MTIVKFNHFNWLIKLFLVGTTKTALCLRSYFMLCISESTFNQQQLVWVQVWNQMTKYNKKETFPWLEYSNIAESTATLKLLVLTGKCPFKLFSTIYKLYQVILLIPIIVQYAFFFHFKKYYFKVLQPIIFRLWIFFLVKYVANLKDSQKRKTVAMWQCGN